MQASRELRLGSPPAWDEGARSAEARWLALPYCPQPARQVRERAPSSASPGAQPATLAHGKPSPRRDPQARRSAVGAGLPRFLALLSAEGAGSPPGRAVRREVRKVGAPEREAQRRERSRERAAVRHSDRTGSPPNHQAEPNSGDLNDDPGLRRRPSSRTPLPIARLAAERSVLRPRAWRSRCHRWCGSSITMQALRSDLRSDLRSKGVRRHGPTLRGVSAA